MNALLNSILTAVITAVIPAITVYVINLLRKKVNEIEQKIQNETVSKYLDLIENIIESCVTAVSQTYVDSLKKSNSFDKAAQAEAFEMCKQKILTLLSDKAKLALGTVCGDINTFIDTKIEYYVRLHKEQSQSKSAAKL